MNSHGWPFMMALLLSLLSTACTLTSSTPPQVTPQGYRVSLHIEPERIWFGGQTITTPNVYLGFGEMVVQVRDAQGKAVDMAPVTFETEPGWTNSATVRPKRAWTRDGVARAIFIPNTSGYAKVTAQIDQTRLNAAFTIEPISETNSTAPPDLQGLPYPPYSVE